MASTLQVYPIPALSDNYIWCIHDGCYAVVVDPGEAEPVLQNLDKHSLRLDGVLITHHHADHVGGVRKLRQTFPQLSVVGPNNPKIKGITRTVTERDAVVFSNLALHLSVLEVPGHTLDHIAYFNEQMLFCGDTLFCGGCGRLFEGTPKQMLTSLAKFKALPDNTPVYCTHEYTLANLAFAEVVEPNNQKIKSLIDSVTELRAANLPSLPSNLALEKQINPFLRAHYSANWRYVEEQTAKTITDEESAFAAVRSWKDNF